MLESLYCFKPAWAFQVGLLVAVCDSARVRRPNLPRLPWSVIHQDDQP